MEKIPTRVLLAEVRAEITRINQAAGHTVFNPAVTDHVTAALETPTRKRAKATLDFWARELRGQQDWMQEHGGSLAGYVQRYGSKDDAKHYGDGGELIYAADLAHLQQLERKVFGREVTSA